MAESTTIKPSLLVVDDSRLMRVAARKILKNEFEIIDAEDGEVAWDILQDNTDIVLLMSDLSMPNLDGLGLLKKMRESNRADLRELPVIIVTGAEDDDGSKASAFAAGASDFITKPFDSVQLLARTKSLARQQRMQQALKDNEALKHQPDEPGSLDPLTELPDKQSFMNSAEEHLAYAIRHRTELSLLVLRLEKYKIMFLRKGKQETEQVFFQLTSLAKQRKRREDVVARIGLDTLAILLPTSNSIDANKIGDQLRQSIAQQNFGDADVAHPVRANVGISRLAIHRNLKAKDLIEDALKDLDQSKNSAVDSPDKPNAEPPLVSVKPTAASNEEVLRALQALATGSRPTSSAAQLARAVIPILEFWNNSNDDRFRTLMNSLTSALDEDGKSTDNPDPLPEPSTQSL